jgi:hypothetical protein
MIKISATRNLLMKRMSRSTTRDLTLLKVKSPKEMPASVLSTREDAHVNLVMLRVLVKPMLKVRPAMLFKERTDVLLETTTPEVKESLEFLEKLMLRVVLMPMILLLETTLKLLVDAETETAEVEAVLKLVKEMRRLKKRESLLPREVVLKDNLLVSASLALIVSHVSLERKVRTLTVEEIPLASKETTRVAREVLDSKELLAVEEVAEAVEETTVAATTREKTVNPESPVLKEIALLARTVEETVLEEVRIPKVVLPERTEDLVSLAPIDLPEKEEVLIREETRKVDAVVEDVAAEAPDLTAEVVPPERTLLMTTDHLSHITSY